MLSLIHISIAGQFFFGDGYLGHGSVAFRHYERPTVFRPADAAYVPHHDGVAGVDARNILRPVSYTHLDVYKRQAEYMCQAVFIHRNYFVVSRRGVLFQNRLYPLVFGIKHDDIDLFAIFIEERSAYFPAVSYTHLNLLL